MLSTQDMDTCTIDFAFKELAVLYEISKLMANPVEIHDKLNRAMKLLKSHSYLERCAVFLRADDEDLLELFASVDLTPQQQKMAHYKFGEGATGLAAESREPVVVENIHNSITFLNKTGAKDRNTISYIAVPLISDGDVFGVVSANMTKNSTIPFDEVVRMLTIAGSIFTQAIVSYKQIETQKAHLTELKTYYKSEMLQNNRFENIIGTSPQMRSIFELLGNVASSDATILVRGETGTGKELIAAAVHNLSPRKEGPFIKLNCAAISETLLESELFGHEKGAFTDAKETRKGRFELADKGTLFLDEIGDISPALQVKLLRILQEQEFERVGGNKTVKVDVRLVAATNRNLEEMVAKKEFREDLFYRLNVIPVNLPPLRERGEDVGLLVNHFMNIYKKRHKKELALTNEAMARLLAYPWPGNIRELENTMERIVLICQGPDIQAQNLDIILPAAQTVAQASPVPQPQPVVQQPAAPVEAAPVTPPPAAPAEHDAGSHEKMMTRDDIQSLEREAIVQALAECHGVQTKAARKLGLTPRQIGYKIKKYNIM